jgi:hypothetical protein
MVVIPPSAHRDAPCLLPAPHCSNSASSEHSPGMVNHSPHPSSSRESMLLHVSLSTVVHPHVWINISGQRHNLWPLIWADTRWASVYAFENLPSGCSVTLYTMNAPDRENGRLCSARPPTVVYSYIQDKSSRGFSTQSKCIYLNAESSKAQSVSHLSSVSLSASSVKQPPPHPQSVR